MKNNNDLLNITQPGIVTEIHEAYLNAGADMIETNSFNGTWVSQADYALEKYAYKMNFEASIIIFCEIFRLIKKFVLNKGMIV